MEAVAMIIWLGVTPAQMQSVQSRDVSHAIKVNVLREQGEQHKAPPRSDLVIPSSLR